MPALGTYYDRLAVGSAQLEFFTAVFFVHLHRFDHDFATEQKTFALVEARALRGGDVPEQRQRHQRQREPGDEAGDQRQDELRRRQH